MNYYWIHYLWKLMLQYFFFSSLFQFFFRSPLHGESFTLYNFLLDHLDRILVSHLNIHSSTCPIKHLLWLSVNCSGWDYTVQESSPHKCGQKSCCSALNAVVTAFLLDISAFLSSLYILEVHPYHWKFLEGRLTYLKCLLNRHSSYPSSITFSDYTLPPFSICDPPF